MTEMLLALMAAAAIMGLRSRPTTGYEDIGGDGGAQGVVAEGAEEVLTGVSHHGPAEAAGLADSAQVAADQRDADAVWRRDRLLILHRIIAIVKQSTAHEQHLADAQAKMDAVLRAKTGPQRLAIADGMWRSARKMIQHHLRVSHPDWSEAQLTREIARRMSHGAV